MRQEPDGSPRVLVIEDEPETADILKQLLELKSAARVDIAPSLENARERIRSSAYDLITLDYQLPDGFGFDLLPEITAAEQHPPVIVVTGRGDEDVASLAFQQGAAGYIVKNDKLAAALPVAVERALHDYVLAKAVEAIRESEAFYRTLFNESADALFVETVEGRIEDVNEAACRMLGYEAEEIKGASAMELLPEDKREGFGEVVGRLLAGSAVESENLTKDGRTIPVEVRAKEVITRKGVRYVVAVRDLSERKISKKALADERAFTMDALNAVPDIIVVADLQGSFNKWNRSLCEVTGYTDEEIDAMRTFDFLSPENYLRLTASLEHVAQTGGIRKMELELITKDGRRIPFELTLSLIRDSDGTPVGITGLGRDISDRKRADEALHNVIRETNERREEITALLESTRLVLEHKDFENSAREIFTLCHKLVGAEAGCVILLEEDTGEGRMLFCEPDRLKGSLGPLARMPVEALITPELKAGKAYYDNAVKETGIEEGLPEDHFKVESVLVAPLLVEGDPAGIFMLANKQGGFSGRDAMMASAFGEIAAVALRDSRRLEMLRSSEERFRSMAESALEAVICADSNLEIIFWNPGAEQIFGHSAEEMFGKPLVSILPEGDRESRLGSMMRESGGEEPIPRNVLEMTGLRKDGTLFPMELSRSTWKISGENNYAAVVRDATRRRKAEEKLQQSEALYRSLLYTSPDAVVVTDLEGNIVEASRATLDLFGYSDLEELRGMSGLTLVEPGNREEAQASMQELLEKGTNVREFKVRSMTGTEFMVETSASVIRDKNGNPTSFITITRDITGRKRAEHEMLVMNRELEGYAHMVSHDLKGPLASMQAAGLSLREVLERPQDEAAKRDARELIDIIEANVRKSTAMINGLLQLAQAGEKPWDVSDVDIETIVKRIADEKAGPIKERRVKLKYDSDLGRVSANKTHMYQLFSNLIGNAIKHNDSRKPEVIVSYLGRTGEGLHKYLVRDNGAGIDPGDIDKIFLPFFSKKEGETGIGLATVEKVVTLYRGTITAYNDNGACFEFTLMDLPQSG